MSDVPRNRVHWEDLSSVQRKRSKALEGVTIVTEGSLADARYISSHRTKTAPAETAIEEAGERFGEMTADCMTELHGDPFGSAYDGKDWFCFHGLYRHKDEPTIVYAIDPYLHIALMTQLVSGAESAPTGRWSNDEARKRLTEAWERTMKCSAEGTESPNTEPVWMDPNDKSVTLHRRRFYLFPHSTGNEPGAGAGDRKNSTVPGSFVPKDLDLDKVLPEVARLDETEGTGSA